MAKVTKLLFSVSEKGNPIAKVWIDNMDISKIGEAIILGLPSQVAYMLALNIGAEIEIFESKGWVNIKVPKFFVDLFDNYKLQKDDGLKLAGRLLNNMFINAFSSLEFEKNGCVVWVSKEEFEHSSKLFLDEKFGLESLVYEHILNSKTVPKLHKKMVKVLEKDDAKQSDIKDAQEILTTYTNMLNREHIQKNNLRIETE